MSSYAHPEPSRQPLGGGFMGAVLLHVGIAGIIIASAYLNPFHHNTWGGDQSSIGAIQATMVPSIPLPQVAPAVDKSVLASEDVTKAPEPPPKDKTAPPPKSTDLLIKEKVTPPKTAAKETPAPPKHPQPTPDTGKAASGDAATQIAQSALQVHIGSTTLTIPDRSFGNRYAYYEQAVARKVKENWYENEVDRRACRDKSVTLLFDIQRDGTPTNVRVETPSGIAAFDTSAIHAIQRIDSFGPLPAGDHTTVEDKFDCPQL
jgi:protein TonB